jgi:uncharacterized protein (DUF488 family)
VTTLLTVGHGTLSAEALGELLRGAGVELLVDVRRYPGSRAHPHLARESVAEWLPSHDVAYRWDERLGGRRRVPADARDADPWWRVEQFRGYAAHTRTPEFAAGLTDLLADAAKVSTAVMCSEAVWWRCHRRLIADVVALTTDVAVEHLTHDGRRTPHPVAEGARVRPDGRVTWDRRV